MRIIPALWRVLGFILLGSLPWMMPGWVSEVPANMVFSKFGFINAAGQEVIPLKFQHGFSYSQDLAPVKVDHRWGFIDRAGKIVIDPKYLEVLGFSQGLAGVVRKVFVGGDYLRPPGQKIDPGANFSQ